jgi:sigma-B regulation protein RsbU (phosphoserine phosphatase)
MKILIADDDEFSRRVLAGTLRKWEFEVTVTADGAQAWQKLREAGSPQLVILDWMMPEMDGLEVCRKARALPATRSSYIILLTARNSQEDLVLGLDSGADDFITKGFGCQELRARVGVGVRVLGLQKALADRVRELEEALQSVKQLQGLLPICSYCKRIRDDQNYWQQVEGYISEHSEAQFSHGICPECYEMIVKPMIEKLPGAPEIGR